jgi:hypothetical protein
MTMDDMVPAGFAAASVVRALDSAVCGLLQRGRHVAVLEPHDALLKAQAADCGGFEVTRVEWQDAELMRADVELRGLGQQPGYAWSASVARRGDAWRIETFKRAP